MCPAQPIGPRRERSTPWARARSLRHRLDTDSLGDDWRRNGRCDAVLFALAVEELVKPLELRRREERLDVRLPVSVLDKPGDVEAGVLLEEVRSQLVISHPACANSRVENVRPCRRATNSMNARQA